jgi:TM2 domain-containing membrane protein YozV
MNENQNFMLNIPGLEPEEMLFLQGIGNELTDEQKKNFIMLYNGKRKDPQTILIMCLIGFIGVAGIQRFVLNQIGMGILYFLTAGLCFIGSIIDIVNYKKMTLEFNQRVAIETAAMVKMI